MGLVAWLFVVALLAMPPAVAPTADKIVAVAANESFNWAGYTQGVLEKGTSFHAVAGDWIVPRAKQRNKGEAEYSLSWIGIGGGCLDAGCLLFDSTLIQAGRVGKSSSLVNASTARTRLPSRCCFCSRLVE